MLRAVAVAVTRLLALGCSGLLLQVTSSHAASHGDSELGAAAVATAALAVADGQWELHKLTAAAASKGAVCLDGSPAAYYQRKPLRTPPSGSDGWVIFMEGGARLGGNRSGMNFTLLFPAPHSYTVAFENARCANFWLRGFQSADQQHRALQMSSQRDPPSQAVGAAPIAIACRARRWTLARRANLGPNRHEAFSYKPKSSLLLSSYVCVCVCVSVYVRFGWATQGRRGVRGARLVSCSRGGGCYGQ